MRIHLGEREQPLLAGILGFTVPWRQSRPPCAHPATGAGTQGGALFKLPKGRAGGKVRDVPLSDRAAVILAEHIRQHPPAEVSLPFGKSDGKPVTSRLLFT